MTLIRRELPGEMLVADLMPGSACPFGRVLKVWPSACEISQMLVERARGHLGGVPKNARAPKPSMVPGSMQWLLLTGTRQDVTR